MKHRVLQGEVVVKSGQVKVLGHQHVWNEGEAGLHGQDVRSEHEGDVSEQIRQGGGGSWCCRSRGGDRWRTLWLSRVAAESLRRSRRYRSAGFSKQSQADDHRTTPDIVQSPPMTGTHHIFLRWKQTYLWWLHDDVG